MASLCRNSGAKRVNIFYPTLILLFVVGLIFIKAGVVFSAPASDTPPVIGHSLAKSSYFDLDGNRKDITDVKAKYMVVIYWAFWCDTWKKALPAVQELSERRKELGCEIWTISVDGRYTQEIIPRVKSGEIKFPVLIDTKQHSQALGIRRVPTVLILDRNRKVIWAHEAYPGNDEIEEALHKKGEG